MQIKLTQCGVERVLDTGNRTVSARTLASKPLSLGTWKAGDVFIIDPDDAEPRAYLVV